ncbi:MAG: tRNA (adenosine(37)-N6)-dimethylallyltransferase MiaA [Deltaproteobacteria bacterium]|nr:tRNA (adenosine(37)-N6)-dimethylallyltransferase MiaA [Deltaproteobacteria bacterium]MBN2671951.1 tRNA (adenosine(37)-N6)-dimethylallyltransferase MiaA [Deltaproteobacteria bacterium]
MSPEFDIPLLVIVGPTASGKTGLVVSLARRFGFEIVGADSMQVYRGMNIGTATPTSEELDGVPHHLIDVVNPDEEYDAARYAKDADGVIADIHARGKRAMVVGGTGLYLRVLLQGLQSGPPPNPALRAELNARAEKEGWPALHVQLGRVDKDAFERLHPNDGVRIVRALEVYLQTGKPLTQWQREHEFSTLRYPHRMLGVLRPKEELNERINRRVVQMFDDGFIEEVNALRAAGYASSLKPMQALGYKPINQHLEGELSLAEAIEQTQTTTRRFAKRQRTWFKKEVGMTWIEPTEDAAIDAAPEWLGPPKKMV